MHAAARLTAHVKPVYSCPARLVYQSAAHRAMSSRSHYGTFFQGFYAGATKTSAMRDIAVQDIGWQHCCIEVDTTLGQAASFIDFALNVQGHLRFFDAPFAQGRVVAQHKAFAFGVN